MIKQLAAQALLQLAQALQRLHQRHFGGDGAAGGPSRLDLPHPFDHHGVVIAVRAAVQRQADPDCRAVISREQQAVVAKIIKVQPLPPQRIKHRVEAGPGQDLAGQNVVALQPRLISGHIGAIDGAKGQSLPLHNQSVG